jgi:hypothetical protein
LCCDKVQVTFGELLQKADPRMVNIVVPAHLVAWQNEARIACHHVRQALIGLREWSLAAWLGCYQYERAVRFL